MNPLLTKEICRHTLVNLGVISHSEIHISSSEHLNSRKYALPETVEFQLENEDSLQCIVWGCMAKLNEFEIKILLVDCSIDKEEEYCLLVQIKGNPIYGFFFSHESHINMIAYNSDSGWIKCTPVMEGAFLCGMESLKDQPLVYEKCTDYEELYKLTLSFIKYHSKILEDYEGQES